MLSASSRFLLRAQGGFESATCFAIKAGNGTTRAAIHTGMLKILAQGMNGALGPMTWDKDRMLHAPGTIIQIKNGQPTIFS